jgi:diguanylate cyclase (GGDEF)-like protein
MIAEGKPIAAIAEGLAEFIPLDFDPKNRQCVSVIWFEQSNAHYTTSRIDLPPDTAQAMVRLALETLARNPCSGTAITTTLDTLDDSSARIAIPILRHPLVGPSCPSNERNHRLDQGPEPRIDQRPNGVSVGNLAYEKDVARSLGLETIFVVPIANDQGEHIGAIAISSDESFELHVRPEMNISMATNLFRLALVESDRRTRLIEAAMTDPLSGLKNRAGLQRALAEKTQQGEFPIVILLADLDAFKDVNDTYGHEIGDLVITKTAQRLTRASQSGQVVGRLGGDEFVVVFQSPSALINEHVQRFNAAINEPITFKTENDVEGRQVLESACRFEHH